LIKIIINSSRCNKKKEKATTVNKQIKVGEKDRLAEGIERKA